MNNKPNRVARLTSSKASLLMVNGTGKYGLGTGAITYIKQRQMELDFGRSINLPVHKEEMRWGKCWEHWLYWQLGKEYELIIDRTTIHPKYVFWSGSEDFQLKIEGKGISELKCFYLENFYNYTKCLQKQDTEIFKKEYASEYWQIVSNCCIHDAKYGEAIAFMPTEENLLEMRKMLDQENYIEATLKDDAWKYRFIFEKDLYDLPFIPSHSDFPSMTKFRFEVPKEDKLALTDKMIKANKYLNEL
jgi:hypothetical protein